MVRRESSVCAQREAWLGTHVWRVTCVVATVLGCGGGVVGEDAPARVADAARVLDLRSAPVLEKAEFRSERNVASLSYVAPATVKEGYAFQEQSLKKDRWQVLDGGYVTDDTASSVFARDGFKVSVTVMPSGKPGTVHVSIVNHGNVDTAQLPTPARSTPFFSIPISTAYLVESSIADARAEVLAQLTAKDWQPYGQAGDVSYFKQGAVRLSARVAAAPAQAGKTFVEYSTEQMSADLPAPPNAKRLQYADATKELSFDTSASVDDVAAFYRQVLTRDGWQATTEQLVRDKFESWLIFRNPQQEMLMLTLREVDDVTRGALRYQTAEDIAEREAQAKARAMPAEATAEAEAEAPAERLDIPLPAGAHDVEAALDSIEFQLPAGQGRAAVEAFRSQFQQAGWEEESATLEKVAGNLTFTKGGTLLTIVYVDTGIESAQISITAIGSELVAKPATKKPKKKK